MRTHGTRSCYRVCTEGGNGRACDDCKRAENKGINEWRSRKREERIISEHLSPPPLVVIVAASRSEARAWRSQQTPKISQFKAVSVVDRFSAAVVEDLQLMPGDRLIWLSEPRQADYVRQVIATIKPAVAA